MRVYELRGTWVQLWTWQPYTPEQRAETLSILHQPFLHWDYNGESVKITRKQAASFLWTNRHQLEKVEKSVP